MARTKGPLFSLEASGSLKKTLVYGHWKGRSYVRSHVIPENPQTPTQVNLRTAWTLLVASWQGEAAPYQLEWNQFAEQFQMSGFNQYMKRGLEAYVAQITTAVTPVSVAVTGTPPIEVWVWT